MQVVIAADKFKGALGATAVCEAIAAGVRQAAPQATIRICPMADGGEGTAAALAAADAGARVLEHDVCGPLPPQRVTGRITLLSDGRTAVLDMAAAAGFALLRHDQRDPMRTTSYGVGELIRFAVEQMQASRQCPCRVIVGLGGSATCDAGFGAAQALGAAFRTTTGSVDRPITGGDLADLQEVRMPVEWRDGIEVICLCDVDNPLFGPRGSAHVFAPQKGATPQQVEALDAGLRRAVEVSRASGQPGAAEAAEAADHPGMGAAGGLAYGLHLATGATLRPGAAVVADAAGLDETLRGATLCFTGEGCFDATSLGGKVTITVARRCREAQVPCIVLAGGVEPGLAVAAEGVTSYRSILPGPLPLAVAIAQTAPLLTDAAEQSTRLFLASGRKPGMTRNVER